MIGRLVGLGIAGTAAALGLDRWLAARRAGRAAEPIRTMVVVDAPIERVWSELADIEGQPRWMREMKEVRILSGGSVGVGTRGEADVRIFGIQVTDPVSIVEFSPPHRFAIRHEGLFKGSGVIELQPGADGTTTIATWAETLIPPFLPQLGALVQRPVLERIFQDDLQRFRKLLEAPAPGPSAARSPAAPEETPVPDASSTTA